MLEAEITDENRFCLWSFEANPLVSLAVCERARIGFLCGQTGEPEVYEPRAWYPDAALYGAEQLVSGESRPWGGVNAWIAAPEDAEPWAELRWDAPVAAREVRLYHRAAGFLHAAGFGGGSCLQFFCPAFVRWAAPACEIW